MDESKRGGIFRLSSGALIALGLAAAAIGQGAATPAREQVQQVRATSPVSGNNAAPSSDTVPARTNLGYVIGPGDTLTINVWNEPGVSGKVPVRPDGMITVPLVGDIQAAGQSPEKLQTAITQKLTEYVKEPSVTVVVEEMNSRQFNVLGQVQHPGSFVLAKPTTVLDALAQAGGLAEFAKTSKIYVLRKNANGGTTKLAFNYKRVANGDDLEENVTLQAGDTVIVP